ncbi:MULTISPECIES: hypothetical protein [Micrococcaceae]|jgi:hypothetical protein|uniref:hypothetical protein n=1 Tax=Micrococcaceae TaxID=1268 RepID=UPI001060B445|nr:MULTISPECIES: hypothetical protein [Micrococcaceae]TDT82216.1 hypothetical protein DFO47_102139 [Arthrobacter sp. AG258]WOC59083.1 hypothetical protein RI444_11015 [Paenarthrobacter sp. AT5]
MQIVADATVEATDHDQALHAGLTAVVGSVITDHPGPDVEAMVDDVVTAVIQKLRLHASQVFVADHGGTRPVERFRTVTGRMDLEDPE